MILLWQVVRDDMQAGVGPSKYRGMKPEDVKKDSWGFAERMEQWSGVARSESCEGIQ
jgi:hypothetical protein